MLKAVCHYVKGRNHLPDKVLEFPTKTARIESNGIQNVSIPGLDTRNLKSGKIFLFASEKSVQIGRKWVTFRRIHLFKSVVVSTSSSCGVLAAIVYVLIYAKKSCGNLTS
ncbi:hypothetical protein CDAR_481381 [Caerostris darwini]|uniref:Uncharacterized protein n=1 Tax=Caerostris darwini TaxID=1538125 RepID=A0AAV4N8G0_9ARAC|nr:hypothetical protein CDAR_481381 [Caerostris darwini]